MTGKELKTIDKGKLVGKITHYFGHASVALVEPSKTLKKGDKIRIIGGVSTDFTQNIESMEIDHKKVQKVKAGELVALKVAEKVREGYKVYKD